jgi:hypothetical protein
VADRQDGIGPSPHDAEPAFARRLVELMGLARMLKRSIEHMAELCTCWAL